MSLPTPMSLTEFQQAFLSNWNALAGNAPGTVIPSGDPIVGIAASNSGSALYLQSLIYNLVSYSRASTSAGAALDSWLGDFGFIRPPGEPAQVVLNVTVNAPVDIPDDFVFQTGSITVSPATAPAIYQFAAVQAYSFAIAGTYQVTAAATTAINLNGTPGFEVYNSVPIGAVTSQFNPIAGITRVTNPATPTGGTNSASDAQARADFIVFITSLAKSNQSGIEAGIQAAYGSLVLGETYNLYSNATAPTLVQPGLVMAVFVAPGKSGQYTGSTFDPNAQAILNSMEANEAFGITPVVYYATQYAVSAIGLTFTYSLSALSQAGLSVGALEQMIANVIAEFLPTAGSSLGVSVFFSVLSAAILGISVTLPTGVVTGIVTDVNVPDLSMTTGSGTFTGDKVQPGTTGTLDQLGYLSWSGLASSITFTAVQAP